MGDTSQHNSVNRGDAFRILQQEAGLKPFAIEAIRRQKGEYKKAVNALAKGNITEGFDRLDKQQSIVEEGDADARYRTLAERYSEALESKQKVLAVAPTHAEGSKVTAAIRDQLKANKLIKGKEHDVTRYANLHLTQAEKGRTGNFKEGQLIRFQKNAKGVNGSIIRGQQFTVSRTDKDTVWVQDKAGNEQPVNLKQADRFNVYEPQILSLASGDSIRITEGGKSKGGKRINNGAIYQVKSVARNGDVTLSNGWVLDAEKGSIDHGYVITSVSSQGKTVDKVFIAQSTAYSGAASSEQFYVSVSRGKKDVEIFTDDKKALRDQIQSSHQRLSATELVKPVKPGGGFTQKRMAQVLAGYAEYVMCYLKDSAGDWLAPFRSQYGQTLKTPANSWQEKIKREQQHDREIEL